MFKKLKTIRIYQEGAYKAHDNIELSPTASQHVGVVLRMRPNDKIILFCGDNREFDATITAVNKKKVMVHIDSVTNVNRESSRKIHLAQAISKGERMEIVVQKAVELGVTSITPLLTTHCVVRLNAERLAKKEAQWQAIAIAACEQSGRNTIPIIHQTCSLEDYLNICPASIKLILDPNSQFSWRDIKFIEEDISLLIGPEGGLSDDEVATLAKQGFQALSLGPRILRTETAAIAAISVIQAICGDL